MTIREYVPADDDPPAQPAGRIVVVDQRGRTFKVGMPPGPADRYRLLRHITFTRSTLLRIPLTSRLALWLPWQTDYDVVPFPQNCSATAIAARFGHHQVLRGIAAVCGDDHSLPAQLDPAQTAAVVAILQKGHPHLHA